MEPLPAEWRSVVRAIVEAADPETMTLRFVRRELETRTGLDNGGCDAYKKSLKAYVAQILDGGAAAPPEKTEDARLFDLIAENYRDFFSLAQSLDTSAEVRNAPPPKPPRARAATPKPPKPPRRSARSRGPRCWPSTARCRSRRACGPTSAGASRTS